MRLPYARPIKLCEQDSWAMAPTIPVRGARRFLTATPKESDHDRMVRARNACNRAVWCFSSTDPLDATIAVSDVDITRRKREHDFKSVQVWITINGHVTKEFAEREVSAWRLTYSVLLLFSSCVVSSVHWCAGSWMFTRSQWTHPRALQEKMSRRTTHVPRRPTENAESQIHHRARVRDRICGRSCRLLRGTSSSERVCGLLTCRCLCGTCTSE